MMSKRVVGAVVGALMLAPLGAWAQDWPAKAVKVIVPFTAGSTTDIVGRTVYEQVARQTGQSFVVENRGGAGTTIGTGAVMAADPDGYTLLVASASIAVIPTSYPKFATLTDELAGVSVLADVPFTIGVIAKYKTIKDFLDHARSKENAINYGTAGAGSAGHLFMEWLALNAGYKATHVPFRGTPEAVTEIVAGRLDLYPIPVVNGVELTNAGRISTLAVSAVKRAPLMPSVPTLAEVGLEKALYNFWVGSFVPKKTPKPVLDRINKEVVAALKVKEVADKVIALGGDPRPMSPGETDAFLKKEIEVNAEIIRRAGVKLAQ